MRALAPCTLLVFTIFAGCVGGGAADLDQETELPSGSGAALAGTVVSEELAPLVGANVTIKDSPLRATTDEAGKFRIGDLPAANVKVAVEAFGYFRQEQEVALEEGVTKETKFILVKLPSQDPYEELFVLNGYSVCEYALFLSVSTIDGQTGQPCPLGEPRRSVIQEIAPSWQYGVVEMTWRTADSFALYIAEDQNCLTSDPCYGIKFGGRSPLRLDMAPDDQKLAEEWSSDGEDRYPIGNWTMHANVIYIGMYRDEWGSVTDEPICRGALNYKPGCPSWGFSTGIPFTTYVTVFNWERPDKPEAYSALPDA